MLKFKNVKNLKVTTMLLYINPLLIIKEKFFKTSHFT